MRLTGLDCDRPSGATGRADISVSRRDLGYAPSIRLEEGIRRFVAWYRDYAKV